MIDISEILTQAIIFRAAIERCTGRLLSISLMEFPRGSCGDVADMLGMFLHDILGIECDYVSGWDAGTSHAWLELDGTMIDITADQFEGNEPVIVSFESAFHRRFEVQNRRKPGIGGASGEHLQNLTHDYRLVADATREHGPDLGQ